MHVQRGRVGLERLPEVDDERRSEEHRRREQRRHVRGGERHVQFRGGGHLDLIRPGGTVRLERGGEESAAVGRRVQPDRELAFRRRPAGGADECEHEREHDERSGPDDRHIRVPLLEDDAFEQDQAAAQEERGRAERRGVAQEKTEPDPALEPVDELLQADGGKRLYGGFCLRGHRVFLSECEGENPRVEQAGFGVYAEFCII